MDLAQFSFQEKPGSKSLLVKPRFQPSIWKQLTILVFLGLVIVSFIVSVTVTQLNMYKFETNTSDVQDIKKYLQAFLILSNYSVVFVCSGFFVNVLMKWQITGLVLFVIGIFCLIGSSLLIAIKPIQYSSNTEINEDQKSILTLIGSMMIIFYISLVIVGIIYYLTYIRKIN